MQTIQVMKIMEKYPTFNISTFADISHVRHSKIKTKVIKANNFQKFSLNFSISPLHNQYQFSANNFFHINTRLQTNLIFSSQLVLL